MTFFSFGFDAEKRKEIGNELRDSGLSHSRASTSSYRFVHNDLNCASASHMLEYVCMHCNAIECIRIRMPFLRLYSVRFYLLLTIVIALP